MIWKLISAPRNAYNAIVNWFWLRRARVEAEARPTINGRLYIRNRGGRIVLGSGVRINSAHWANPIGGSTRTTVFVGPGATLTIGDNVGMSNVSLVCNDSITIEDNVLLGGDVRIYDTDFHALESEIRNTPEEAGQVRTGPVVVGRDSFVGAGSMILRSSNVGAASIVGAMSVVRGTIPPGEIWIGNPARQHRGAAPRQDTTRRTKPLDT